MLLVGDAGAAHADRSIDLTAAPPLLPGGSVVGSVTEVAAATTTYDEGSGPCVSEARPDGVPSVIIFRQRRASEHARLLELSVADDVDATPSLCSIEVYRSGADGMFTDPTDATQRGSFRIAETRGCSAAGVCSLRTWLPPGEDHFIAFWSARSSSEPESRFIYDAKVRRRPSLHASVSGHRIRDRCRGYHEVIKDRRFTVTVRTTRAATGRMRFHVYRHRDGAWRLASEFTRVIDDGTSILRLRAGAAGRWRVQARFDGNAVLLPARSEFALIRSVAPRWRRYGDGGVRLRVPYHRQAYRLSCEAATLRMAHNYFHRGRITDDMQVYRITGIDKRRPAVNGGCNPNRAFCGNVNGLMMRDGYGVHGKPIKRAATSYDACRPAVRLRGARFSASAVARQLNDGYPVIVWGAHAGSSGIYRYRWRAWDGQRVTAWSVEHTWTVIGFRGSKEDPTHFIIHDPSRSWYGGTHTVTRARFRSYTKYFNDAVVVRG